LFHFSTLFSACTARKARGSPIQVWRHVVPHIRTFTIAPFKARLSFPTHSFPAIHPSGFVPMRIFNFVLLALFTERMNDFRVSTECLRWEGSVGACKVCNKAGEMEGHNLFASPHTITVIKSKRMGWAGHAAWTGRYEKRL
jgi:hypothetical protein